jgi:hypothetical protein
VGLAVVDVEHVSVLFLNDRKLTQRFSLRGGASSTDEMTTTIRNKRFFCTVRLTLGSRDGGIGWTVPPSLWHHFLLQSPKSKYQQSILISVVTPPQLCCASPLV